MTAKWSALMDFGAFVSILPGKDGLVHISQISHERVEKVSDKLSEGDRHQGKGPGSGPPGSHTVEHARPGRCLKAARDSASRKRNLPKQNKKSPRRTRALKETGRISTGSTTLGE